MSSKSLFEIVNGKARITEHAKNIWLLNNMIDSYGEQTALKIFKVLDYMADLTEDNPFKDVSEIGKLEFIINATCPETTIDVDWNSDEMIDSIELVRKLYETPSYRHYLANKILSDKLTEAIRYTSVDTSKELGNASQIEKTNIVFEKTRELTKKIYNEFLEEQNLVQIQGKGKVSKNSRILGGKSKDLE